MNETNNISVQGLAYIGDAVFELMVRTWLCVNGTSKAKNLHNKAIAIVSAKAQALAVDKVLPKLNEEELSIYKRGRNAHTNSVPKASTHEEYHSATGIETLFGHLFLNNKVDRLNELFSVIVEENQSCN